MTTTTETPATPALHELAATVHDGTPVLDLEDGYLALTHDRDRALAAIRAFHDTATAGVFHEPLDLDDPDLETGWLRPADAPGPHDPRLVPCDPAAPGALPATFLYL